MGHPLFCHHNHHRNLPDFDKERKQLDHRSLLGYADADLVTAAGARPDVADDAARIAQWWPKMRTTGYGRAVTLVCQELFGLEYCPENFEALSEALKAAIEGKSPAEVHDHFVREKSNTRWVLNDAFYYANDPTPQAGDAFPDYYCIAWRMDELFAMVGAAPIGALETATGVSITNLDRLVEAMNTTITKLKESARLGALKIGMAYSRDLLVGDPTRHEAEAAFNRIRGRKTFYDGIQQENGAVSAAEARPLADYLFHRLIERANDDDIPVQIHTGYLAGNWGSLNGTNVSLLIPIFDKYRRVRFDIFHASWPWTSELGAIAKNYPNVYPDLCWAWAMNPAQTERALSEWLDAVPFNKIFSYGADTGYPWCDVGYALQARIGIARVLEQKVESGDFSDRTAEEVAEAVMLRNGEEFFGLA
jgi:predicted TIM-barrel fold metal-dependent hydrolase